MNEKINDVMNDVIHTASQAIIVDDEAIKIQALGDIYDAIASLVPADHHAGVPAAESSGSTVYRTPMPMEERRAALKAAERKELRVGMLTDARREATPGTGVEV